MPGPRYEQQSEFFGDPEKLLSGLGLSIEGQQKQAYNTWHAENADRSLAEDLALRTRAQGEVEAQNRWQQLRDRWAEQHQQTTDDRGWREKVVQNYVGRIKTQQELIATQIESMKASRARAQARGVSADTTALKANAEAASDLYTAMDAIDRLMGQQKDRGGKSPAEWTKLYNDWDGRIKNKTLNGQPTASYLREFVKKDKAGRDYDMAWVRQGVQTATQTLKDNEVGKLDETQFAAYINELVAKAPQPQQSVLDQIMFGKLGPLAGLDQKAQEGAQKRNALPPLPGSPSVNRPSTPPQVPPPSSTFLHLPPPSSTSSKGWDEKVDQKALDAYMKQREVGDKPKTAGYIKTSEGYVPIPSAGSVDTTPSKVFKTKEDWARYLHGVTGQDLPAYTQ